MSKVKIYVCRDKQSGKLHLRDSEGHSAEGGMITDVRPGDEIEWVLGEGVDEITRIRPVGGSQNILRDEVKNDGCGRWASIVSESAQGEEEYEIEYVAENASRASKPKLKVEPPE